MEKILRCYGRAFLRVYFAREAVERSYDNSIQHFIQYCR